MSFFLKKSYILIVSNNKIDALDRTNGTDYFADGNTNNWSNGQITKEVRVTVPTSSEFEITISKEVVYGASNYRKEMFYEKNTNIIYERI